VDDVGCHARSCFFVAGFSLYLSGIVRLDSLLSIICVVVVVATV